MIHAQLRLDFENRFTSLITNSITLRKQATGADGYIRERALEAVCKNVMIFGTLIRGKSLRRGPDTGLVPTGGGSD